MSEWVEVAIQELCSVVTSGGTPSRKHPDYFVPPGTAGAHPWVKTQEIADAAIHEAEEWITDEAVRNSSAKLLPAGTILMAMYAAPTAGRLATLRAPMTCNQAACALIPDYARVDGRFLYYALMQARGALIQRAHGAAQQNLSQQLIKPFRLRVPGLLTQRRVGGILASVDELIENNRRRIEVLEEAARAIYREWFVRFRFPGHEDRDMVDSSLGLIPKGWRAGSLRELATISSGKRPPTRHDRPSLDARVPVVGASSVMAYTESPLTQRRVLVTGRVGTHGVVQRYSVPVWPSDNTLVLNAQSYEFTYHVMLGVDYRSLNRGAAQPLLTQRDLSNVPTVVPDDALLQVFEREAGTVMAFADVLEKQSAELGRLRDWLLPKLVTGQVDVSALDLGSLVDGAVA